MMKALQMMERYIDIDTSQIVRQVLLSEGYDQSLASVGTVVPKEPPRMEAGRFVPHLARWYEDLVDNVLSKPGEAATLYIIQFQWSKSSTGEAATLRTTRYTLHMCTDTDKRNPFTDGHLDTHCVHFVH
jgi:hypothetical protein